MESGFASVFTKVSAWTEAVCCDKCCDLQSLRSPMVNVRKCLSKGSAKNGLKIEIKIRMQMVHVKMEILNAVAKWGGSITDDSASIFLSTCLSFSVLNSLRAFPMVFTSSAFAVTFALVVFNSDLSFLSLFTSLSPFSLLMSFFDFFLWYWL